ncbi:MAG: hypothetical protein ACRBC3_20785 [Burkholderiaceae bacterium]
MDFFAQPQALLVFVVLVAVGSFALSPRRVGVDGFFGGASQAGRPPGLWTLVLSQVTTWIFARSLMNAAILGYYYGIAGTLAYTLYYASFLTGMWIVGSIRADGGSSVQQWLRKRFGASGTTAYNIVVGLRLMSEVFANLLVIGTLFGAAFATTPWAGNGAMIVLAVIAFAYAAMGGLRASLKTDVAQMLLFLLVFAVAFVVLISSASFTWSGALTAPGVSGAHAGWVLLLVAALQVFSYPAHDPVMMDRGFIADAKTTRKSFLHAFWLSAVCIFAFGLFGIEAGRLATEGEAMQAVWARMFGPFVLFCLSASLIVSALSTLDSALASAARLAIVEMSLGAKTVRNGRLAMAVFALGGVLFLLAGSKDLFAAVAVSGTASMFLAPVLFTGLILGKPIPLWSFFVAFAAAMLGALAYFAQSSELVITLFGDGHKYERLLWICIAVLVIGFAACGIGARTSKRPALVSG